MTTTLQFYRGLFMRLTNLTYLNLSRNQINPLDESLMDGTNKLAKLNLAESNLLHTGCVRKNYTIFNF